MTRRRRYSLRNAQLQELRNAHAQELAESVEQARNVERFGLYLRPFFTTNKLPVTPELPNRMAYRIADKPYAPILPTNTDHADYEDVFRRALGDECPLIAVGGIDDIPQGVGRLVVEEAGWRDEVARLISRASIIVLIPFARPGTWWEFQFILSSDAVTRTAFLMPEDPLAIPSDIPIPIEKDAPPVRHIVLGNTDTRYFHTPDEWRNAVIAAQRVGIELPHWAMGGALFTIQPSSRSVGWIDPLVISLSEDRVTYVAETLAHHGLTPWRRPLSATPTAAYLQHLSRYVDTAGFSLVLLADAYVLWGHFDVGTGLLSDAMLLGDKPRRRTYDYLALIASQVGDNPLPPAFVSAVGKMIIEVLNNGGIHEDPLIHRAILLREGTPGP